MMEHKKHRWECFLDGKHGSQEMWKCQDCGEKFFGNPHKPQQSTTEDRSERQAKAS